MKRQDIDKKNVKAIVEAGEVFSRDFFVKKGEKLIERGEIDLGFCKIFKKEIRGGKGKSHGTEFKIGKYYKLGVRMSEEFKSKINKD